jgi:hypothetical protein
MMCDESQVEPHRQSLQSSMLVCVCVTRTQPFPQRQEEGGPEWKQRVTDDSVVDSIKNGLEPAEAITHPMSHKMQRAEP